MSAPASSGGPRHDVEPPSPDAEPPRRVGVQPRRVGVLASGRGSNLKALLEAARGDFPARIVLVLSDNPGAAALGKARDAGVAAAAIPRADHASRNAFEAALDGRLREAGVEIVCLAGFMRVLSPWFVERWAGRVLNIHPSLLPAFRGLDTHARALAAGVKIHGATVHHVTADLDAGPIVIQAAVPVLSSDDEASLAARVLAAEHRIYPEALRRLALTPEAGDAMARNGAELVCEAAASCLISPLR